MESRKSMVQQATEQQIERLLAMRNVSAGKAALARLRKGIGHAPGELPQLWDVWLAGLPEEMYSKTGQPTREEWAVYIALTLFALHQQGKEEAMHQHKGPSLGTAVAGLVEDQNDRDRNDLERNWKRLVAVMQAMDIQGAAYHLRGLVQLLKGKGISLDYAVLAGDLYDCQFAESRQKVGLRWGQDYFSAADSRVNKKEEEEEQKNAE